MRQLFRNVTLIVFALAGCLVYAEDYTKERQAAERFYVEGKTDEFLSIATKLSKAGDAPSQVLLGKYYFTLNDYKTAELWLKKAAESGDAHGQYSLGDFYALTEPSNDEKARYWIKKSADQGFERAKMLLATTSRAPASPKVKKAPDSLTGK